jgi:hypothetical protein
LRTLGTLVSLEFLLKMDISELQNRSWLMLGTQPSVDAESVINRFVERCGSLIFKDNREQNIGVKPSLTFQWPDSIQNEIFLFLFDINEVHRSRVLCSRRSSALNFVRETNHEKKD